MSVDYRHKYLKYKNKYLELKEGMVGGKKKRKGPEESATLYSVGKKKTGNDGNKWIVAENKRGIKRWKLYRKVSKKVSNKRKVSKKESRKRRVSKMTPESRKAWQMPFYGFKPVSEKKLQKVADNSGKYVKKVYNTLVKKIIPALKQIGIHGIVIPLPLSDKGQYWMDYAYTYIKDKIGIDIADPEPSDKTYMTFEVYMNHEGDQINDDKSIFIDRNKMLDKDTKIKIVKIFTKYLPDHYELEDFKRYKMKLHFHPRKMKKIDISKIK